MDNVRLQAQLANIPLWERDIPAIEAEYWFQVDERGPLLEGVCFDVAGNMWFVDTDNDILYRLDMQAKQLSKVFEAPGLKFASVKAHEDGRLFVCSLNPEMGMFTLMPDGTGFSPVDLLKGHVIDDLVFDRNGGLYFTELTGECNKPDGAVFHLDAELRTVTPVVTGLSAANGVALSVDGSILWVTETTGGRLLRFELDHTGLAVKPYGSYPSYHFAGNPGPDSCTIDGADHLYVALYHQGRFMVFQRDGLPVTQILLPDRERGWNLGSTHCKIRPGTDELYLCSSTPEGGRGAWIFKAKALAPVGI